MVDGGVPQLFLDFCYDHARRQRSVGRSVMHASFACAAMRIPYAINGNYFTSAVHTSFLVQSVPGIASTI